MRNMLLENMFQMKLNLSAEDAEILVLEIGKYISKVKNEHGVDLSWRDVLHAYVSRIG